MTINLRTAINFIIIFVLASTPFISYGEVGSLLSGEVATEVKTPIYVKVIKDVGFILIMIISSIHILKKRRIEFNSLFLRIFSLSTIMLFFLSWINLSFSYAAAGIRWAIPIALPFFLIQYVDDVLMNKIAKLLFIILIIQVLMQIYQIFTIGNIYGINFMGLAARPPGIFQGPVSAGFFSIMVLFFIYFFLNSRSVKVVTFVLSFISIILATSGTSIIVYMLFVCFVVLSKKYRKVFFQISPLFVVMFLPIMIFVAGRGESYFEQSFMTRVNVFTDLLMNGELISTRFGSSTNTVAMYAAMINEEYSIIPADSIYSSIIGNIGLLGFFLFVLLFLFLVIYAIRVNRLDLYLFIIIFALFGMTTIFLEVFPVNLLFSIYIAYILRNRFKQSCLRKEAYSIA